jgi:hypothetical protein
MALVSAETVTGFGNLCVKAVQLSSPRKVQIYRLCRQPGRGMVGLEQGGKPSKTQPL